MNTFSKIQEWFVSLKNKVVHRIRWWLTTQEIEEWRSDGYMKGRHDAFKEVDDVLNWKPDEDQIDALRQACYQEIGKRNFRPLFTLYKQLRRQYFI